MEPSNQIMLDLLTNTPFVGFLVWQYVQMRKDIKEQQQKTDELRNQALRREEEQRIRFEKVIAGLNDDKDQLVKQLESRLTAVEAKIEVLHSQIKKVFSIISKTEKS